MEAGREEEARLVEDHSTEEARSAEAGWEEETHLVAVKEVVEISPPLDMDQSSYTELQYCNELASH